MSRLLASVLCKHDKEIASAFFSVHTALWLSPIVVAVATGLHLIVFATCAEKHMLPFTAQASVCLSLKSGFEGALNFRKSRLAACCLHSKKFPMAVLASARELKCGPLFLRWFMVVL